MAFVLALIVFPCFLQFLLEPPLLSYVFVQVALGFLTEFALRCVPPLPLVGGIFLPPFCEALIPIGTRACRGLPLSFNEIVDLLFDLRALVRFFPSRRRGWLNAPNCESLE